jgi:hypothetical protein
MSSHCLSLILKGFSTSLILEMIAMAIGNSMVQSEYGYTKVRLGRRQYYPLLNLLNQLKKEINTLLSSFWPKVIECDDSKQAIVLHLLSVLKELFQSTCSICWFFCWRLFITTVTWYQGSSVQSISAEFHLQFIKFQIAPADVGVHPSWACSSYFGSYVRHRYC